MKESEEGDTQVPSCHGHLQGRCPMGGTAAVPSSWQRGTGRPKSPGPRDGSALGSSPVLQTPGHHHSWAPMKRWKCLLGPPCSAVHLPWQGADSLSLVLFPASSFLLQGGREHRKRLGEAPKWQLQESIAVLVTEGYPVQAGQAQSPPCLASGHGVGGPPVLALAVISPVLPL